MEYFLGGIYFRTIGCETMAILLRAQVKSTTNLRSLAPVYYAYMCICSRRKEMESDDMKQPPYLIVHDVAIGLGGGGAREWSDIIDEFVSDDAQ